MTAGTSDESLTYEVCRVCWYPVTPLPSVLREAGAEDPEEKIVLASVGDGVAAPPGVTYIQHSHWSSSYNTALSLVQSSRVVKYFHALKGPIIGALSDATPAVLCHKEPARRKNTPY